MLKLGILAAFAAAAYLRGAQEEGKAPPDVKVDAKKALEIVEKEFAGEEKIFISSIKLVRVPCPCCQYPCPNENRWQWTVEIQTYHAGHWGPAGCGIDAMTGAVIAGSTHDHK